MNPVLPVVHGWLRPGVRSDAEASEEAMCVDSQDEQWLKSHFRLYLLFGFSYYSSAHNPCLYSFCQRLVLNSTLIILALNQMYFLALLFFFFFRKMLSFFFKGHNHSHLFTLLPSPFLQQYLFLQNVNSV